MVCCTKQIVIKTFFETELTEQVIVKETFNTLNYSEQITFPDEQVKLKVCNTLNYSEQITSSDEQVIS